MTLRHLRIFHEVMERGSATRAAERLGMTQPAVSIALGELETFYEARLFDRVGRRLVPTEAGRQLDVYAGEILSEMEASVFELREKKRSAPCRIGINVTVGEGRAESLLAGLREGLPEARIFLRVERNEALERLLGEGMLDFAVLDRREEQKYRGAKPLFSERMKVVCAPSFSLREMPAEGADACEIPKMTGAMLARQPLLLREKGSGARECADSLFAGLPFPPLPAVESVSSLLLLSLAKAGEGVAILPASLADREIASGKLRELPLPGEGLWRRYALVCRTGSPLSPEQRACMALLERLLTGDDSRKE